MNNNTDDSDISFIVHSSYTDYVCKDRIEYCEVCKDKKVNKPGQWCDDCGEG